MNKHFKKFFTRTFNDIPNFNSHIIEMRSDVKTLPTQEMINSLKYNNFGDDDSEEDPTINKLISHLCNIFHKERGLFISSGTMGNIIGLGINCERDEYIIQGTRSHLYKSEIKAQLYSGFRQITTSKLDNNEYIDIKQLLSPDTENKTKIIAFENTHNYNGGTLLNMNVFQKIRNDFPNFKYHLDGSRLFNASVAGDKKLSELVLGFDTINICFSKGIGAPCGSVLLLNDKDYIKARHIRKCIGGSMRQAGFLASPILVALEDWEIRMKNDHNNAKYLYDGLKIIEGLEVKKPESNIVNIYLNEKMKMKIDIIVEHLRKEFKVYVLSFDNKSYIRAVLHHQVTKEKVQFAIDAFDKTIKLFNC